MACRLATSDLPLGSGPNKLGSGFPKRGRAGLVTKTAVKLRETGDRYSVDNAACYADRAYAEIGVS